MSPRAAARLESLGFRDVYDYVAGKVDWLAAAMPTEGKIAQAPTAGSLARRDVPTCRLVEHVGDVRTKVRESGVDLCVVVNSDRVVLGVLRERELASPDDTRAEDAMRAGPSTFRPHVPIADMASYMSKHDLASAPVTTADGRLLGVLFRSDAEDATGAVA